jgi:hypothetical protein
LVIVPIRNDSRPESLQAFFKGTSFNQNILRFVGPRWMSVRFLPLNGMLSFGWGELTGRSSSSRCSAWPS